MHTTKVVLFVLGLLGTALADTEIRNFHLPLPAASLPSPPDTIPAYSLPISSRQLELSVSDQQPELRVRLDAEKHHGQYTARISWPASSPTVFELALHPCSDDDQAILHIVSQPLSPRFPHRHLGFLPNLPTFKTASPEDSNADGYNTTFHLVFEPLVYGVVPQTSVLAIKYILCATVASLLLVPFVIRFIEKFASTLPEPWPVARRVKTE